jgi:endonuclease/exonuclease/phosphatase (EEP) superfamily protein YafD
MGVDTVFDSDHSPLMMRNTKLPHAPCQRGLKGFHFQPMDHSLPSNPSAPGLDPMLFRQLVRWLLLWCGRLSVALMLLWTVALALLALGFRYLGESNLCTAFLLFLPPVVWLLPGVVIWPVTLLLRWRAALVLGAAALLIVGLSSGWRPGTAPIPVSKDQRDSDVLVILTNNRGQGGGHSLRPFKNHIQPDLMAFQESSARASTYLSDPGYGEFQHGESVGEFTLLSRFPVIPGRLLSWSRGKTTGGFTYAARFEVDWNGRQIAVYVVHLRSPREALLALRWGAFLRGIPLPVKSWQERANQEKAFWLDQMAMAEDLEGHISSDPLPCIIAGDFNAPHLGAIHRRLTRQLQDAHAEAGFGWGFTFPGETRNPLAFGGPWLRIDHVLVDWHWSPEVCWTEESRKSQHRAVAASLRWRQGS